MRRREHDLLTHALRGQTLVSRASRSQQGEAFGPIEPAKRFGQQDRVARDARRVANQPCVKVDDGRWLTLAAHVGRIGFSMDRKVLMTVLHYRYGLQDVRGKDEARPDDPPATATEERLATTLGLQLVNILALRIDTPETGFEQEIRPPHDFVPVPAAVNKAGSWTLSLVVRELTNEVEGLIRFRLDEAWMNRLLRNLAPSREKSVGLVGSANVQPLGAQLPLTIVARLLEQDMPLGALMDLRVGDVIPVRLGTADVLVEDACLFEASVAEHQGKLCLTSFEDIE